MHSSYVEERVSECRATYTRRGGKISALQRNMEKRVQLLTQLLELKTGSEENADGLDEVGFVLHQL